MGSRYLLILALVIESAVPARNFPSRQCFIGAQVLPGPATALRLDCKAAGSRLAATNGADAKARLILAGAVWQLHDEHGNAVPAASCKVRLSLQWQAGQQGWQAAYSLISIPSRSMSLGISKHSCEGHTLLAAA